MGKETWLVDGREKGRAPRDWQAQLRDKGMDTNCFAIKQNVPASLSL